MMIEFLSGEKTDRVLVTMEAAELDGYGVTFSAMSLGDPPTRALLRDLLSMVTRMGLRHEGEQVQVDCARTGAGGCALLISRVEEREYRFASGDDIIALDRAVGMPAGKLTRQEGEWIFRPEEPLGRRQRMALSQFCVPDTEEKE